MTESLNVYLGSQMIGRLWLDNARQFVFQYAESWLQDQQAVPLSLQLPLQAQAFEADSAKPFFTNLLPEGGLRSATARRLGLSERNDYALLEAIGGECAGAVSVLPEGSQPGGSNTYHTLHDEALNQLIADLPRRPMLAGETGMRLSLAGAQNKLPVYFDGERISLTVDGSPSSHILKPPIAEYPDSVYNEWFCIRLAERVGLSVPKVIILAKDKPLYLIERYDRKVSKSGSLERLHQEDFCQALGIAPDQKYEKEGGPGLVQCFNLLRDHSVKPVADIQMLLKWVIFNVLIGNADAHGKNISLLWSDNGPVLAPFYDLMSTAIYPDLTDKLAMKIGAEDRPDWIIERRWRQFAKDVDIGDRLVLSRLVEMQEQVVEQADQLVQHSDKQQQTTFDRIRAVIDQRSKKINNMLAVTGGE